jgi:hypothetical protein
MSTGFSDSTPSNSSSPSSSSSGTPTYNAADTLRNRLAAIPEVVAVYGQPAVNLTDRGPTTTGQSPPLNNSTSSPPTDTSAPQTLNSSTSPSNPLAHVPGDASSSSSSQSVAPKKVKIKNERRLQKHVSQSSDQIVQLLTRNFPATYLPELEIKITADSDGVTFNLECKEDAPDEVMFKFLLQNGGSELHVDLARIGYKIQQGGIVKQLMNGLLEFAAQETKVKEITLLANLDIGGYAWARYGFIPKDPNKAVGTLQDNIQKILASKTFSYDGVERVIVLDQALTDQLTRLASLQGDPQTTFALLSNSLAKVQIPGGKVRIPIGRFAGGGHITYLIDKYNCTQSQYADSEDKANYKDAVIEFDEQIVILAESLETAIAEKKIPFSNYSLEADDVKVLEQLLILAKPKPADPLQVARTIDAMVIQAVAAPIELSLSAVLMIGTAWDGRVERPSANSTGNVAQNGWDRLEKYVGHEKKGSKQ